jgi:hypothetical protein
MHAAVVNRRLFLGGIISLSAAATHPGREALYDFETADCETRMSVVFYDRISSSGFWFRDLSAGNGFCLSAIGEQNRACAAGFAGSVAIARYRFRPRSGCLSVESLREHVCTIDRDTRLDDRPPFDRVIELRQGLASDIQAFGYQAAPSVTSASARLPESGGPWYYFRQELYFAGRTVPFLIVHWRHAFGAIRILDVIPGAGTSSVRSGER